MNPHLWVGLPGLATDIQTVKQKIEFRMNMYELKETRQMRPKTFANMVSNMLYERRFGPFFVEPIVAGLDPETHAPYICNMDLIGASLHAKGAIASGEARRAWLNTLAASIKFCRHNTHRIPSSRKHIRWINSNSTDSG